ncbi:MAG: sporulation initiation factor Spo0A C-terminal domain-containing protein [Christensenella sp.]|nr:sporulation initiation factor Spo0A C-terminal domain-containing protein [Christensenella sp.]
MHPKYAGYGYSLAILRITHRHPEYIYRLPKMVYPRIMELFGCTRSALDRNIRFAIERTWENGNQALLSKLFGAFGTNLTPTNIEFISVMTDFILYGSFEDPSSDEKLQAEAL